jgi:hypothetical protein
MYPECYPSSAEQGSRTTFKDLRCFDKPAPLDDDSFENCVRRWHNLCEAYSRSKLTYASDRIMAFSGAAEEYQQLMKMPYLAGFWRSQLERQLIWRVRNPASTQRTVPEHAPTWSWLSVEGAIVAPDLVLQPQVVSVISEAEVKPSDPQYPFGPMDGGRLRSNAFICHLFCQEAATKGVDLKLDTVLSMNNLGCYLFPLILDCSAYTPPKVSGLVLISTAAQLGNYSEFRRIGIFEAKGQAVCKLLQHKRCKSSGCTFKSFRGEDEAGVVIGSFINYHDQYRQIRQVAEKYKKETDEIKSRLESSFMYGLKRQEITII